MPTVKRQKDPAAPLLNPAGWDASHGTYIAGRAVLDGVDALAAEMEAKWGCDRLRLLVSPELREKFDRQRYRLNAAVLHGDLETLRQECRRMTAAWLALDNAALMAGARVLDPEVWEVALDDGSVAAIVKDNAAAHKVAASGRKLAIYTLEEIAKLFGAGYALNVAKLAWPGAEVVAVRKSVPDPLKAIRHATSFDDPLDDLFHPTA